MIERINVRLDSPNPVYRQFVAEHLKRYEIAADEIGKHFAACGIKGPRIVDAACGDGYGYACLKSCGSYRGFDIDQDAIDDARMTYPGSFTRKAIPAIDLSGTDCVVCLETAEHLIDPCGWLARIRRSLPLNGLLVFSVPTSLTMDFDPYHRRDWSSERWMNELFDAGFFIRRVVSMPFSARFTDFLETVPTTFAQKLRVASFNLTHWSYLRDRLCNWILRNRFEWCSTLYVCVPGGDQCTPAN